MQTIQVYRNSILVYSNNIQAFNYAFDADGFYRLVICGIGCTEYTIEYYVNKRLCKKFNTDKKKEICFEKKLGDRVDVVINNIYEDVIC